MYTHALISRALLTGFSLGRARYGIYAFERRRLANELLRAQAFLYCDEPLFVFALITRLPSRARAIFVAAAEGLIRCAVV